MITTGRMVAVAVVGLCFGFVGGVWFIGSDLGRRFVPAPKLPPPATSVAPPNPPVSVAPPAPPKEPVIDLWPVKFRGGSTGLLPKVERTDLLPAPGCRWHIEPRPFQPERPYWVITTPERALYGSFEFQAPKDAISSVLVQSCAQANAKLDLRPVFFDEHGTRYAPLRSDLGGATSHWNEHHYSSYAQKFTFKRNEHPPRDKVAYFGIERVAPNAEQLLSEAAQRTAREMGISTLPIPQVGKPYPFDLTTVDGKRLRSEDFRGRSVLIGVWDGLDPINYRYSPNSLKEVREADEGEVADFICISLSKSVEEARATLARAETHNDSLIVVPDDPKIQKIWCEGAQIIWMPTYFLIDRDGILRHAGPVHQVSQSLNERFGRKPFFLNPKVGPPRNFLTAEPAKKAVPLNRPVGSPGQVPGRPSPRPLPPASGRP